MRDGLIVRHRGRPREVGARRGGSPLDALRANRLRSALTMLGVIIGVAAVVILVAIGTGTKQEIEQQVEGLGSNLLLVVPGQVELRLGAVGVAGWTLDDVDAVSKIVGDRDRVAVDGRLRRDRRAPATSSTFATVNGVIETRPNVFVRPLARGTLPDRSDVDTRRRVAVLGSSVADDAVRRRATRSASRSRSPACGSGSSASSRQLGQSLGVDRDNEVHVPITDGPAAVRHRPRRRASRSRRPTATRSTPSGARIVAELDTTPPGHRVQRGDPGADPRRARRHPRRAHRRAGRDRRHLAAGRRRRRLQHHAGLRAGADQEIGLRKAVGARPRDIGAAVPARGGAAHDDRRAHRASALGHRRGAARRRALAGAGRDHLVVAGARVRGVGRGRASSSASSPPSGPGASTRWSPCAPSRPRQRICAGKESDEARRKSQHVPLPY